MGQPEGAKFAPGGLQSQGRWAEPSSPASQPMDLPPFDSPNEEGTVIISRGDFWPINSHSVTILHLFCLMGWQTKYSVTVGNCPQFKNKKIEPQGHQSYSQVQQEAKIHLLNNELSRKWHKFFILEGNLVDYDKTVINIKYVNYTLTMS